MKGREGSERRRDGEREGNKGAKEVGKVKEEAREVLGTDLGLKEE